MEENKVQDVNEIKEENKIDSNASEIIKKAGQERKLSDAEKKMLIQKINEDFDFRKMINDISMSHDLKMDKFVIFTNGKEQLYYEDGEFFLISTTDSKKAKKKIKREEARNLYNEYYMITVLNPLLKQKAKGVRLSEQVEKVVIANDENTSSSSDANDNNVKDKEKEIKKVRRENIISEVKNQVNEINYEEVKEDKKELDEIEKKLEELKKKEQEIKAKRKENEAKERS